MILKPLQWIIIKNYYLSLIASFFYKKIFPKKLNSTEKKKRKILFAQTIFWRDENLLNLNIKSIESLWKYFEFYNLDKKDFIFSFSWWTLNDEYWEKIENVIKKYFNDNLYIKRFQENLWKSTYINEVITEISKEKDFTDIFTYDSDIIFDINCENMFNRLINQINFCENLRNQEYWILWLNLIWQDVNLPELISQNRVFYDYKFKNIYYVENIMFHNLIIWIAWACWIINRNFWEEIWWYKIVWKYWPEDWLLLQDCWKLWYSAQVSGSVFVIHNNIIYDYKYVNEKNELHHIKK